MPLFSFGLLTVAGAVLVPALWLIFYGFRRFGAFIDRKQTPSDRVPWYLAISLVFGVVAGSLLQPGWDRVSSCHDYDGTPYAKCVGNMIIPAR